MKSLLPFVALALTAASPIMPTVKPADATAQFQGDGGRILFDPACRDYDVVSVPSNPSCAARVAAGETAASLAVAVRTGLLPMPRRTEIIVVLERAIAKENHPAAHYLLGSGLSGAVNLQPDYARAVRHLTIAAERGNPAAADLLASLIIEGKGAPRDIPRAITLFRQAIDGGFPAAARHLAMLYLSGQHVTRDDAFGSSLMQAAATAGDQRAAQLAPMTAMISRTKNYQLLPAADGRVTAKAYSLFENPEIPPSFGYDDAFRAVHFAPFSDPAIRAGLERDAANRPTPYLYELARRLSDVDTGRAQTAYLLARMRMIYDVLRCVDPSAREAVAAWQGLIASDLAFALEQLGSVGGIAAARAALAQEATLPADTRPWWVCHSGMAAMSAAMSGKPLTLALKPAADWPALRAQSRQAVETLAASTPK